MFLQVCDTAKQFLGPFVELYFFLQYRFLFTLLWVPYGWESRFLNISRVFQNFFLRFTLEVLGLILSKNDETLSQRVVTF